MKTTSFIIFLLFSVFCVAQTGKVIKIKDGDTVVILDKDNKQHTIRIADIDCPEYKQPFSKKAKQFVSDEIYLENVNVQKKTIDSYGRIVGFILYEDKNLSEELLKQGLAWHYVKYSTSPNFQVLEDNAKKQQLGLWVDPDPVAPWQWRKQKYNR